MRVALDAMGGDHAPGPIVDGAVHAVREVPGLTVVLVGDQAAIEVELQRHPDTPRDHLPVVHAREVIGMHEKPVEALRRKRDNSISKCWGLLAGGEVNAVVSAGSTGAMVASALFNAKMFLPGVRRPAIAAIYPSLKGPVVLLDVGANMNPKPEDLHQYGILGAVFAEQIVGIANPTIGLLNVGSEEDKGNELVRATRELFRRGPVASKFVGYVEGRDIYDGHARVLVCEGFTGNVLLKSGEGAVEYLFGAIKEEFGKLLPHLGGGGTETGSKLLASLKELKARFEYEEFGGGPLLGIRGACLICHGSSGARAIKNACRVAGTMAEDRISRLIVEQLEQIPPDETPTSG